MQILCTSYGLGVHSPSVTPQNCIKLLCARITKSLLSSPIRTVVSTSVVFPHFSGDHPHLKVLCNRGIATLHDVMRKIMLEK